MLRAFRHFVKDKAMKEKDDLKVRAFKGMKRVARKQKLLKEREVLVRQ